MNLPEKIRTIDNFKELTFKEKKSAFIAQVYSVNSVKAADEFLSETKKKYYDASHHCFAYKLIDATIRYSDSGEPSGTAGVRILSAIDHFNLSNQLVVVTRYYGGIKLGVGPLGKAYYNAAHKILSESAIKTKTLLQKVLIKSEVNHINHIYKLLSGSKSIISRKGDEEVIVLDCLIPFSEIDSISKKLIDITANKIEINPSSKFIYK